jgi:RNase P subunit RPR2
MFVVPLLKTKICNTCKESLPLSLFTKNKAAKDLLQAKCKVCDNKRQYSNYFLESKQNKGYASVQDLENVLAYLKQGE